MICRELYFSLFLYETRLSWYVSFLLLLLYMFIFACSFSVNDNCIQNSTCYIHHFIHSIFHYRLHLYINNTTVKLYNPPRSISLKSPGPGLQWRPRRDCRANRSQDMDPSLAMVIYLLGPEFLQRIIIIAITLSTGCQRRIRRISTYRRTTAASMWQGPFFREESFSCYSSLLFYSPLIISLFADC